MELEHRDKHVYIVGKSGSGKSVLLEHIAHRDICDNKAIVVIDPHGELAKNVLSVIPRNRTNDVCYIDLSDPDHLVGFNPLLGNEHNAAKASADLTAAFKDIFSESWGPRLQYWLYMGLVVLNEKGASDITDLSPLYYNKRHREKYTSDIKDPAAREFWLREYLGYDEKYRRDAYGAITNKIGQLISSPVLRAVLTQHHPKFNLAQAIAKKQIVVVNLAKGIVGREPAMLLGSLIVSKLASILFASFVHQPVVIIADEFQNYASDIWGELFSESRKYGAQLVCAHQFVGQLSETVRSSILGNAGTTIAFRCGAEDAPFLIEHLALQPIHIGSGMILSPTQQLMTIPPYSAFCKTPSNPTTEIITEPPLDYRDPQKIIFASRRRFARRF